MQAVSSLSNLDILSGHDETEPKDEREQETHFHFAEAHGLLCASLTLYHTLVKNLPHEPCLARQ
jgi:hypothetical protein